LSVVWWRSWFLPSALLLTTSATGRGILVCDMPERKSFFPVGV
jgi:hypothetical protein